MLERDLSLFFFTIKKESSWTFENRPVSSDHGNSINSKTSVETSKSRYVKEVRGETVSRTRKNLPKMERWKWQRNRRPSLYCGLEPQRTVTGNGRTPENHSWWVGVTLDGIKGVPRKQLSRSRPTLSRNLIFCFRYRGNHQEVSDLLNSPNKLQWSKSHTRYPIGHGQVIPDLIGKWRP